jgi:putative ABC transport system ATP-binding protein
MNGAVRPVTTDGVLVEAKNLVLAFGETPALRGADLSVQYGEILAVMGPSGSGKSILLHCLAGILVPNSGEVIFDGQRLDAMREGQRSRLRRDRFGFVFQFGQLVPELTAEENIALPLLLEGTPRKEALRVARSWLEPLELDGMERHRTGEMSGGQSQRVALARGLVAHPDVLFADEPTGSLDSLSGELVMGLLIRAVREQCPSGPVGGGTGWAAGIVTALGIRAGRRRVPRQSDRKVRRDVDSTDPSSRQDASAENDRRAQRRSAKPNPEPVLASE